MKSKAIIFDLDGTAVDTPGVRLPSKRTVAAMRKAETGYYLCAATGRSQPFAAEVLEALELKDPAVIASGTQIYNPLSKKIIWQSNIEPEDVEKIIKILQADNTSRILHNSYSYEDYFERKGTPPAEFKPTGPVHLIEYPFVEAKRGPSILEQLKQIEGIASVMMHSMTGEEGFVDILITNANATKEHAIAELLHIINVDRKNTIGIGDGHNDLHLFNGVDYKVAMGNAVPEVKAAADLVINSVEKDGLAEYLETL